MKKIVRQQNYLKELIDAQENQPLSKVALRCIIRSCLEPLLDEPEESVVLHRIINKSGLQGLLKRLEYSAVESYDFSDESEHLKEKVWANTEFLAVLTHRFVAITIWDGKTDNPNYVRYYTIYNSKLQNEALDIIARNTDVDIKDFQERFKPDRRDNVLMNSSIRKLIMNLDEAAKDAVLGFAQVQYEKEEFSADQNIREIAHEVRNQLSICDLYSEIMKKHCLKLGIKEESIINAAENISRAVKMAGNSLIALKSKEKPVIKSYKLKELISNACDLTKVYYEGKNVECILENDLDVKVPVDENKLSAVIINLIKNASEAFLQKESDAPQNGKYIKLKTEEDEDFILIKVSNNAGKIEEPNKIFKEGYTTKENGTGLGLAICKKNIEEMYGKLLLEHNENDYVEFAIKLAKV
ncbi:HAMP domain-containing histidine kinase [bacterium]|nr:HAMP domain-containing histidine kinase [bacterium]